MSTALGYQGFFGFGSEGTWATAGTVNHWLELNTGGDGLMVEEERLHSASVYQFNMDKDNMQQGAISISGDLTFDMRYEGIELLLKAALGSAVSTQQGTTAAYAHVFGLDAALGTGLTIEIERDLACFQYIGCKVNTLAFNISNTGFLVCTVSLTGQQEGTQASPTGSPTFSTSPLVVFDEGAVTWGTDTVSVISASWTLNNNLSSDRRFIGSRFISEQERAGKIEVTGSFTAEFDGTAKYNDFRNASTKALQLKFTGAAIASGGTNTYLVQFDFPYVYLTGGVPQINNEGIITVEIPFKAYADGSTSATREVQVTLRNTVTAVA